MSTAADVPCLFGDRADVATLPDVTARLDQASLARENKKTFCYPDWATVKELDPPPGDGNLILPGSESMNYRFHKTGSYLDKKEKK
jgi:hypothetical protein